MSDNTKAAAPAAMELTDIQEGDSETFSTFYRSCADDKTKTAAKLLLFDWALKGRPREFEVFPGPSFVEVLSEAAYTERVGDALVDLVVNHNWQSLIKICQELKLSRGASTKEHHPFSDYRGPIVVTQYGGTSVDTNKDDPHLKNAKADICKVSWDGADTSTGARLVLGKFRGQLASQAAELKFFDLGTDESDEVKAYHTKRLRISHEELGTEESAMDVFDQDANEQEQMHCGGTPLVINPLKVAKKIVTKKLRNDFKSAKVYADREWKQEGVLTHTSFAERLRLKPKPDAWFHLEYLQGFALPAFQFNHKTQEGEKAFRKAILASQLTWRRIFVARCSFWYRNLAKEQNIDDQQLHEATYDTALEKANDDCKNVLIWFASLDGVTFRIGALVGLYDRSVSEEIQVEYQSGKVVKTHARFKHASTDLHVHNNSKESMNLMYELALHLPMHFSGLSNLFKLIDAGTLLAETNAAVAGSKRKVSEIPRPGEGSRNKQTRHGEQQPLPENTKESPVGFAKKKCAVELLEGDADNLKYGFAIPNHAIRHGLPFDHDHILSGTWCGDSTRFKKGRQVTVKAFSGTVELDEFINEVEVLKKVASVPHVQQSICAKRADHLDFFAVIVSPSEPSTAWAVKSLLCLRVLGRQILEALVGIHRLGIIHRDVKPENILWSPGKSRATLIDFGLAAKATLTRTSPSDAGQFPFSLSCYGRVGTDGYQAPELVADDVHYNEQVDVYGLGKSLQKIASAADIHQGDSFKEAVALMTKSEPTERCSAVAALGLTFLSNEEANRVSSSHVEQ